MASVQILVSAQRGMWGGGGEEGRPAAHYGGVWHVSPLAANRRDDEPLICTTPNCHVNRGSLTQMARILPCRRRGEGTDAAAPARLAGAGAPLWTGGQLDARTYPRLLETDSEPAFHARHFQARQKHAAVPPPVGTEAPVDADEEADGGLRGGPWVRTTDRQTDRPTDGMAQREREKATRERERKRERKPRGHTIQHAQ